YLSVIDPLRPNDPGLFGNVDWTRTRAYGLGLNGLYINVRGREAHGIVDAADRGRLAGEIASKLVEAIEPATGEHPIRRAFKREDVYTSGVHDGLAPDVIVGYGKYTRGSDDSALGAVPREVLDDNTDWWSGDHCIDPELVPGILLTSRPLRKAAPNLQTL